MTGPGTSAVLIAVPRAEALVGSLRGRFDPSAAQGVPAHITALVPFLPEERLSAGVLERLREICARTPVLDVEFRTTGRFPGVLYLAPAPAEPIRALTLAIAAEWPEAPPYQGEYDEVIPHLTAAFDERDHVLDSIEAHLRAQLPIAARLPEAALYVFDGERWRPRDLLPFEGERDPALPPVFRHYADPIGDGTIERSDAVCVSCERARGWIATSHLYTAQDVEDRFCPWCIADGTAAARFDGTFNELAGGIPTERRDLVDRRTPNFPTWQDVVWPVHCGDGAIYLGIPAELPPGVEAEEGGDAHLFRCTRCDAYITHWDMD
jgi:hypothetical protein